MMMMRPNLSCDKPECVCRQLVGRQPVCFFCVDVFFSKTRGAPSRASAVSRLHDDVRDAKCRPFHPNDSTLAFTFTSFIHTLFHQLKTLQTERHTTSQTKTVHTCVDPTVAAADAAVDDASLPPTSRSVSSRHDANGCLKRARGRQAIR